MTATDEPRARRGPEISPRISVGNLLHVGVLLVGLAGAYYALTYQAEANAAQIRNIGLRSAEGLKEATRERRELDAARIALEVRVRGLETEQARADERFSSILGLLSRIDGRLERIETAR